MPLAVHRDDAVCGLESSCGGLIDESTRWENMVVFSQPKLWKIQVWHISGLTHLRLPSGKLTKNYGKSPFLMGKSTISTGPFSIAMLNYQRVIRQNWETPLTSQNWEDWKLDRSKPKRQKRCKQNVVESSKVELQPIRKKFHKWTMDCTLW